MSITSNSYWGVITVVVESCLVRAANAKYVRQRKAANNVAATAKRIVLTTPTVLVTV